MAYKVFFSYAHKDEELLEKLKEHLSPLKSQGLIDRFWYDRDITAGTEWEPEIVRQLDTADIILLLISSSFMSSDYCYGKELKQAIERHERKEARVIPIILSPVYWQIPPLDKLQALPRDAKPVTGVGWHSVDEALVNVVNGVRATIKVMQKRQKPTVSRYQAQIARINEQAMQGKPPMAALREYDPELAELFLWIMAVSPMAASPNDSARALQAQIESLVYEIAAVGDDDLRVRATVTADALGVIADSFNYLAEQLVLLTYRTRQTSKYVMDKSLEIQKLTEEQKLITEKVAELMLAVYRSLPKESDSERFTDLAKRVLDLNRRIAIIHGEVVDMHKVSETLLASTSAFKLPELPER